MVARNRNVVSLPVSWKKIRGESTTTGIKVDITQIAQKIKGNPGYIKVAKL